MAKYNYDEYAASKQAYSSTQTGNRVKTHFMGEYLKNDGDSAIVRFPYRTMNDVTIESGHVVTGVFPNNFYGKFVTCTGDDSCPLCKAEDANVKKVVNRCYVKMIVYTTEGGKVVLNPTIWERKAFFADNDLKTLMTEYGDLTKTLFKITRTGSGTATRYNILPIMNKAVYPDEAYIADFTELDTIDPVKVLAKTPKQYLEALNPTVETEAPKAPVTETVYATPVTPVTSTPVTPQPQVTAQPVQPTVTATQTTPGRYKF